MTQNSKPAGNSGFQNAEIPAAVRDFADRSVTHAKEVYDRAKTAAAETANTLETTYEQGSQNAKVLGTKLFEAAQVNAEATFDLFRNLVAARTFADAVEAQSAFARKQFEIATAQFTQWQQAAQQVWTDAGKPTQDLFGKAFNTFRANA